MFVTEPHVHPISGAISYFGQEDKQILLELQNCPFEQMFVTEPHIHPISGAISFFGQVDKHLLLELQNCPFEQMFCIEPHIHQFSGAISFFGQVDKVKHLPFLHSCPYSQTSLLHVHPQYVSI